MAEIHGVAFGAPQAAEHAGAGALGATQAAASALAAREPAPRVPQWAVDYSSGAIAGMACVAVSARLLRAARASPALARGALGASRHCA